MAPLITFDEALALGELTDHDDILALVERAWEARQERFGDSTDLCSLVNAKSGGCAEDCGFCAQSRYAEADTPMHAMMEPEQILEHARAAEAAGAHRFCMVTQGQGLSKRDFEKVVEGAKLVSEHTNLKRCVSIGHISPDAGEAAEGGGRPARPPQRRVGALVLPRGLDDGPLRGPAAHDRRGQGGRARELRRRHPQPRREPAPAGRDGVRAVRDRSRPRCRSTCSTRAPGTKFGDRELMDPWEVVKWVAIFRLIIPGALFRLCGGRVENLGDLQPLAVKAGPERRDDGQLPDHARLRAGRRPRDVRGAGPERRPPAGQRRQPAPRQPLRLARGRDPADADRRADRQPGRGQLLGSLDAAAGDQEEGPGSRLPERPSEREQAPAGWGD